MSVVTNGLTNSIVKLKMEEYKKDLSKFENGVSRKFTFSDTSIVTGREIKFFPITNTMSNHGIVFLLVPAAYANTGQDYLMGYSSFLITHFILIYSKNSTFFFFIPYHLYLRTVQ